MRKTADWEAIELRYRAGTESLRCIAASFDITEGAIRQRAKKEGWSRDLQARVRQATEAALLRKAATHDVRTEREAVEVEAEIRSEVILRHRKDIQRGRALSMTMLGELEAMTTAPLKIQELNECLLRGLTDSPATARKARVMVDQALSLGTRVGVLRTLTESIARLVTLEREAFGQATGGPSAPPAERADPGPSAASLALVKRFQEVIAARAQSAA